jgi:hypothetical protein
MALAVNVENSNATSFNSLSVGDVFEYGTGVYMKTSVNGTAAYIKVHDYSKATSDDTDIFKHVALSSLGSSNVRVLESTLNITRIKDENETYLKSAESSVQDYLDSLSPNNNTTKESVLSNIKSRISSDITANIYDYTLKAANVSEGGYLSFTVNLTRNDSYCSLSYYKEISQILSPAYNGLTKLMDEIESYCKNKFNGGNISINDTFWDNTYKEIKDTNEYNKRKLIYELVGIVNKDQTQSNNIYSIVNNNSIVGQNYKNNNVNNDGIGLIDYANCITLTISDIIGRGSDTNGVGAFRCTVNVNISCSNPIYNNSKSGIDVNTVWS